MGLLPLKYLNKSERRLFNRTFITKLESLNNLIILGIIIYFQNFFTFFCLQIIPFDQLKNNLDYSYK